MSYKESLNKCLEHTKNQLSSIRTGRANPSFVSNLQVEYYGSFVPLQQLANITAPENNLLVLNIFDRGAVQGIEKAITTSDLNLTPQTEGTVIRLRLPELTEERRKELVKVIRKEAEEGKVAIRNLRRDEIDSLKTQEKSKEITEDDLKRGQEEVQKITNEFIDKIDAEVKSKESEIMTV